jgi:hypothetical protein
MLTDGAFTQCKFFKNAVATGLVYGSFSGSFKKMMK